MHVLLSSFSYEDRNSCKSVGQTHEGQMPKAGFIRLHMLEPAENCPSAPHPHPKNSNGEGCYVLVV